MKWHVMETVHYTVEAPDLEAARKKFLEADSAERDSWVDHVEDRSFEDEYGEVFE